jgi:bifunctional non-homologous end joining protein LigD
MSERLGRYREMRDFRQTPEPRGDKSTVAKKQDRLRYYIQRHDARRLHYDFRLELDGALKSWAVPKGPSLDPHVKRLALEVEDHPLEYGEFEGTIPEKQYGAGDVLLWDKGVWIPEEKDPAQALRKGRLHFILEGEKLHGRWVLTRTNKNGGKPQWLLIKRDDEEARPGDGEITLEKPESVKRAPAKRSRARKSALPQFVAPMLATLVTEPPSAGKWVYEVKYDGYRMLARISGDEVRMFTRTGKEWTAKLPHVVRGLKKLGLDGSWLDGEIVVRGTDGRSSFQALQNAFDASSDANIVYYVFDAPFLKGQDLRRLPLKDRKSRLERVLKSQNQIQFSAHLKGDAPQVLAQACKLGLEGLIGKETDSVYVSGRSKSWIKLKCRQRQDFVIGGYTEPGGSRQGFGALLVGYHEPSGKLSYAGKVGTGFDAALLKRLSRKLNLIKTEKSPFENPPKEKGAHWVRPELVGEVAYAERTKEGILRQASFMGLREDLPAKAVAEEKPLPPTTKITHPERLVWPSLGITKLELVRYCEEVGERLLEHLKNRPLSLVRCPDGAEGKCFYQRHPLAHAREGDVLTFRRESSGKRAYIYVNTLESVISLVQNGALEFHTWGCTIPDVKHPDRFTIDLDPDPALPWKQLVEATKLTRTLLDGLGLKSFLKTTGGKGLHVVAPIEPKLGWDEAKEFTRLVAAMLTKARPDLFIDRMAKVRRGGKVFVDYLRNAETASAVAAYSPRARPGATVSTPLAWEELGAADVRAKFTLKTVPRRLKRLRKDPWSEYSKTRQSITAKMRRSLGGG